MEAAETRRGFLISKAWIQAVVPVVVCAEGVRHYSPLEAGVLLGLLVVVGLAGRE